MKYTLEEIRAIPIFFIVGKGRSGTTLLSTILDSHPDVASATESRFLLIVWQKYKKLKRWSPERANEYVQDVLSDFRVKYFWEFEDDFEQALSDLPPEATAQDLIKLTYLYKKSLFQKSKVKFIIDKNPRYTLFVWKLSSIFKDGKFIRIMRDPRDNIASSIKYNKRRCEAIAYKWLKYNQTFDKFESQHPSKSATFKFEDLITDKNEFFERFEAFTGITGLTDVESERLKVKDAFEEKLSDKLKQQHGHTVKPLDPKKVGHFESKLSKQQIQYVESVTFPYAKRFNYESVEPPVKLTFKNKFRFTLHYFYKYWGNQIIYNLPYPLLVKARTYIFKNMSKGKKEKFESMIQ